MAVRYFPVAQDINGDQEVWELTDRFGDRALRIWLEILSISDRNTGVLKGTLEGWANVLMRVFSKGNQRWVRRDLETVQRALRWMSEKGWIEVVGGSEPVLKVVNHAKYHRLRGERSHAPNLPNLPNLTNPPIVPQEERAASPNGFAEFWDLYPKKKSKGAAEKAWKTLKPDSDLLRVILAGIRRSKSTHDWLKQSGQFIPYPATWLRAKGWEDQGVSYSVHPKKNFNGHVVKATEEKLTPEQIEENQSKLKSMIEELSGKMAVK